MAHNFNHNNEGELDINDLDFSVGPLSTWGSEELSNISEQMVKDMVFGDGNSSYENPGQYIMDKQLENQEETRRRGR